jgi:hypothetical protein
LYAALKSARQFLPAAQAEGFLAANSVNFLLLRYPALQDNPFNEKSLQKAGCDLEKGIALWQLAEERRSYAHRYR